MNSGTKELTGEARAASNHKKKPLPPKRGPGGEDETRRKGYTTDGGSGHNVHPPVRSKGKNVSSRQPRHPHGRQSGESLRIQHVQIFRPTSQSRSPSLPARSSQGRTSPHRCPDRGAWRLEEANCRRRCSRPEAARSVSICARPKRWTAKWSASKGSAPLCPCASR